MWKCARAALTLTDLELDDLAAQGVLRNTVVKRNCVFLGGYRLQADRASAGAGASPVCPHLRLYGPSVGGGRVSLAQGCACAPRGQDAPRSEGPRRVGERALDRAGLTRRAAAVSRGRRGFATQPRPRKTERDRSPGWITDPP